MKNIRKFFSNREHGFSLLEMSIAVGIMAIGLVIALPNFTNAIQTQQANDVKNNLIQSGMILEQARFANDGSYPTQSTIPTEISSNAKYAAFTYTTDSASQRYCIMGRDSTGQKYYISSDAPSVVYTPTEANPSCSGVVCISPDQTNCPKSPVISTPSVTGSNTWSITTQPAALANMSWGTSSCAWSGSAPTNAGPISGVDYQVRVIQTPSGAILNAFNGSYTSTNSLTGFSLDNLPPGTSIQYQVRARCLADYEYYYTAWSYVSDTVARFPLTKPATPTATTSWPAGQGYGTASFTITAITCPSASYTPVYQATLAQTDGQAVIHTINAPSTSSNSGWQTSNTFNVTLIDTNVTPNYTFAPGTNSFALKIDVACQIGTVFVTSTDNLDGTNNNLTPPPPTAPSNIICVTKYKRLTENNANIGGCNKDPDVTPITQLPDTAIVAASMTPDGVRWTPSVCQYGTLSYQAATRVGTVASPGTFGSYSTITTGTSVANPNKTQYAFGTANASWTAGSYVGVSVVGYCTYSGLTSSASTAAQSQFTTNNPPPIPSAPTITWTADTSGVGSTNGWSDVTTVQGTGWLGTDGYMYDHVQGSYPANTCSGSVAPLRWNVFIKAKFPDGTTLSNPNQYVTSSSTLSFNRSDWTAAQTSYWVRGAAISFYAQAVCPSSDGVYDGYSTLNSADSPLYQIGYPQTATDLTLAPYCVTKYIRTTEATKGNCTQDPFTSNTILNPASMPASSLTMAPNAIAWNAAVCTTGYTPTYAVYNPITATYGSYSTPRLYYLSGLSATGYTFKVKFKCTATGTSGTSSSGASLTTTESGDNTVAFTATNPPSFVSPSAPNVAITYSTGDTGGTSPWNLTTQQGGIESPSTASYMYDQITGTLNTPTVCPAGYSENAVRYSLSMPSTVWTPQTYAAWSSTTAYTTGTIVVGPDGNYWSASAGSTGAVPYTGSASWSKVTYSAWSSATAYSTGNIVSDTAGRLWKALSANTNNNPEGAATPTTVNLSGTTAVLNRSSAPNFTSTWSEGAILSVRPAISCSSPDYGSYTVVSAPTAATSITIGYTQPTELISSLNCWVLTTRDGTNKEATMGNCNTKSYSSWSSASAYAINDIVVDSSGYLWVALAANTNSAPSSTNANWANLNAPEELTWSAVSAAACAYKPSTPRYWISADNGTTWTKLGAGVTSYAIGKNMTPGTAYTYAVRYDCYDSTSTRYSAPSNNSTKTFTASYPYLQAGAIDASFTRSTNPATITWNASESDGSWVPCSTYSSISCGVVSVTNTLMYDYLSATLGGGTVCPTGYAQASTPWTPNQNAATGWVVPTVATNNATTLVFTRSLNSSNWIEGVHLGKLLFAKVNCSNSDYASPVASSLMNPSTASASYQVGVFPPTVPSAATSSSTESGIMSNGLKQANYSIPRYYTPLSETIVNNPDSTVLDTYNTKTATQWTVTKLPTCNTYTSVTPSFSVTNYDNLGTPWSTSYAYWGSDIVSYPNTTIGDTLTATAYDGGITQATLSGTCTNSSATGAGISPFTVTSGLSSSTLTSKVYEAAFTKINITDTAAGTDTIKGNYDTSPCKTGQVMSGATTRKGYVGYNGTGITAGYGSYAAYTDPGAFLSGGVATNPISIASPWTWNGYTNPALISQTPQVYGVRVTYDGTCVNNTNPSNTTVMKGWVTFWVKNSSGSRNGPGYTNNSNSMGVNTNLWSPQ